MTAAEDNKCVAAMITKLLEAWRIARALKGPNVLTPSRHGPIITNANDIYIAANIRRYGSWQGDEIAELINYARRLLSQRGHIVFYDIGANIGTHSLAMAKAFGDRCLIRAFEPQEEIYRMLCGTIALNNIHNVHCHNMALAEAMGPDIVIQLPDYAAANNFGGLELMPPVKSDNDTMVKSAHHQAIPVATIDHFAEEVNLIKIDVEGMEDRVLRGAVNTIAKFRPVIFVEASKTDIEAVKAFLAAQSYAVSGLGETMIAVPAEWTLSRDI
jgi:FkbM family methyltransferase